MTSLLSPAWVLCYLCTLLPCCGVREVTPTRASQGPLHGLKTQWQRTQPQHSFFVSIRMSQPSHYPGHHSLLDVQIGYTCASLERLQTTNSLSVCGKLPPGVEPDPHTNSEHHPQLFYCWHNLFNTFHLCQEHKRWLPPQCKVQKENPNLSET